MEKSEIKKAKKLAEIFLNLHSAKYNENGNNLITETCDSYAKEFENVPNGNLIFKVIENCILTPKKTDIKKVFGSSFRNIEIAANSTDLLRLAKMLICSDDNFSSEMKKLGASEGCTLISMTLYDVISVENWSSSLQKFKEGEGVTDFDREFIDFITGGDIKFNNWMLDAAVEVALHKDTVLRGDLYSVVKNFFPEETKRAPIDSLIISLLSYDILKFTRTVYEVTNDEAIAAHAIDIIYTVSEYNTDSGINSLSEGRSLALRMYVETILPVKELYNDVYSYLSFIPNSDTLVEQLVPIIDKGVSNLNKVKMGKFNKFECNFQQKVDVNKSLENARSNGHDAIVEYLEDAFTSYSDEQKMFVLKEIEDLIKSDFDFPPKLVIQMLNYTEDPELQTALTERVLNSIQSTGNVPLYQ